MGCPSLHYRFGQQPFCLIEGIRLLKCVKEGVEFEITIQESRGFGVRALQGRVLAEKTVGPFLLDHLPRAFRLPQEAYQALHSASRTERTMANEQPDARRPEPLLKSDSILTSSKHI